MYQPSEQQIRGFVAEHFPNFREANSQKVGPVLRINSPFDDDPDSKSLKFNIILNSKSCKDWRGNDRWRKTGSSSFMNFMCLYLRCTFKEAVQKLLKYGTPDRKDHTLKYVKAEPEAIDAPLMYLPSGSEKVDWTSTKLHQQIAVRWLKKRGFTAEIVETYRIMVCGINIVFPYYEYDELVYWQQRLTGSKIFEYPDAEIYGVGKSDFLYNCDAVDPNFPINVFESITNAITIGRQAVATGSADFGSRQLKKIETICRCKKVVLAFDRDKAGIEAMVKFYKILNAKKIETYYALPPKIKSKNGEIIKDWNELYTDLAEPWSFSKIREAFKSSVKLLNMSEAIQLQLRSV